MIPRYNKAWVYRRPNREGWWVGWYQEGRRKARKYPTKRAAEAALRELEHRLNNWLTGPRSEGIPFGKAVADYATSLSKRSPAYRRRMAVVLQSFIEIVRPTSLADCTHAACEQWLSQRNVKPATLYSEYAHLKAFLGWCVSSDRLESNPLAKIPRPSKPQTLKRSASDADWLALLDQTNKLPGLTDPQGWYLLIVLAVVTGLRRSALLTLKTGDIELGTDETDGIGVLRAYTSKTHRESLHGIPKPVADMLSDRIAVIGSARLFLWPSWPRKQWDRIRAAALFPDPFHALRATSGVRAALARLQADGAAQLGHTDRRVFGDHYADHRAFAIAAAQHVVLPALPPLPAFVDPSKP